MSSSKNFKFSRIFMEIKLFSKNAVFYLVQNLVLNNCAILVLVLLRYGLTLSLLQTLSEVQSDKLFRGNS